MNTRPKRAAHEKARVLIGRIAKPTMKKNKEKPATYYWVTGNYAERDKSGNATRKVMRGCAVRVDPNETVTYARVASQLRTKPTAHPRGEVFNMIAVEITSNDHARLAKPNYFDLYDASGSGHSVTVLPFKE